MLWKREVTQGNVLNVTPLESEGIYIGDAINIKPQFIIECGVKDPSFLTGGTDWPVHGIIKKIGRRRR
jgi:hypothetical protein